MGDGQLGRGSGCWRGGLRAAAASLPPPAWQSPRVFGTRAWAEAPWGGLLPGPGFAVVTASALAWHRCSWQGGKGQEPYPSPVLPMGQRRGNKTRPEPRALAGFGGGGLPVARSICRELRCWAAVPGEGWAGQMCAHSWGEGMPTPVSCSQPLVLGFNPKSGLLVPPPSLSRTSPAWGWLLGVQAPFSGGFYFGFVPLHLSPPKKGAGWALLRALRLLARHRLLYPRRPGAAGILSGLQAAVPGEQGGHPGSVQPRVRPRLPSPVLAGGNRAQVGAEGRVSQPGSGTQGAMRGAMAAAVSDGSGGRGCRGWRRQGPIALGMRAPGTGGPLAWCVTWLGRGGFWCLSPAPAPGESPPDEFGKPIGPAQPCAHPTAGRGGGSQDGGGGSQQTCVVLPLCQSLQQTPACHPVPRGGDGDPREPEGPAGLAHHGEAKGLRLLALKTAAGEAQGREKRLKLPYNAGVRTTRCQLPRREAGLGMTGVFFFSFFFFLFW